MPKRCPENFTHISLHIGPQNIFAVSMLFCFTISCLEDFFLLYFSGGSYEQICSMAVSLQLSTPSATLLMQNFKPVALNTAAHKIPSTGSVTLTTPL